MQQLIGEAQTTLHIFTAAGRNKFLAILCDYLFLATLNAAKYDAFNNFSFDSKDFLKPYFCLKYSLRFLLNKTAVC